MRAWIKGGLFVAGFAGTAAIGVALRPTPAPRMIPPIVVHLPEAPATKLDESSTRVAKPMPELTLPTIPIDSAPGIDKTDPAFDMIRKEMGHKTGSLLNDLPPIPGLDPKVPVIPASGRKDSEPPTIPMGHGSPMPRLETPPPPDVPPIPFIEPAPAHPKAYLLNHRDVSIDFEVTSMGGSPIRAVELWASRDSGKTWEKLDRMVGAKSPFKATLGAEGSYGLMLIFESESGLRSRGNQVVPVQIDLTPPVVRIDPAMKSNVAPAGNAGPRTVRVEWSMEDKSLDVGGTRIEYSVNGRNWFPMTLSEPMQFEQKGTSGEVKCSALWELPTGIPHGVMVRVTARDLAGNQTTAEIPQKLTVDLVAPEGRIRGIEKQRPIEVGPMPRIVQAEHAWRFVFVR